MPEGYVVDVLPKSQRIMMIDNKLIVEFIVKNLGRVIQVNYNFMVKDCLINPQEYSYLKIFWEQLLAINNEQIILKRAQPQPQAINNSTK